MPSNTKYSSWGELIADGKQTYLQNIGKKLDEAADNGVTIYPARENIFQAFKLCPLAKTRVVILGQDPYHAPGQANGLAFSTFRTAGIPKSLQNIFVELVEDCLIAQPTHGDLSCWATQGILLLNTILTVEKGKPLSHEEWGWQKLTMQCLKTLSLLDRKIIFVLWGRYAGNYRHLISDSNFILQAAHPSPLSAHRGFLGCKHFSTINKILAIVGSKEILWDIT